MKICLLNASNPIQLELESDEYVDLRDRKSCFASGKIIKQCRSWHSWTYALESEFFVYNKSGWQECFKYDGIIILVNRNIGQVLPLVKKLRMLGKCIAICFHEGVQDLLHGPPEKWIELQSLVKEAGVYINIFGQYQLFFEGLFQDSHVVKIDHTTFFDWDHGLTIPYKERTGDILIGTRTFNQRLSRNTLVTLAMLSGWQREHPDRKIDFICEDGFDVQGLLSKMGFDNVTYHKGPLEYNAWLRFLANYKYVVTHDLSMNLGQISLDALIVDIIPVGGTTWINQMLGTDDGGSMENLLDIVNGCIPDATDYVKVKNRLHPDKIKESLIWAMK